MNPDEESHAPLPVSKATFLAARNCLTKGWYTRHIKSQDISPGERLRREEGQEVGRRARSLYPDGVLVCEPNLDQAIIQTQRLLVDPAITVLFEATFRSGKYVAKADILARDGEDWYLIEVKSGTSPKSEYMEDVAYTATVLEKSGIRISRISLMTVSPEYEIGKSDQELFNLHECTDKVTTLQEKFATQWEDFPNHILATQVPAPEMILSCRSCDFFYNQCIGKNLQHSIFELPDLNKTLFEVAQVPRAR